MADQRKRDIQPAELAALVDLEERPRVADWSLRAALCRYAQPQPQRVSDVLDLVRRIQFAIDLADVEDDGPALWEALQRGDGDRADKDEVTLGLLAAMAQIDRAGDALAGWAVDRSGEAPDPIVDEVIADVTERLARLGVPHQERPQPTGRGRGRG